MAKYYKRLQTIISYGEEDLYEFVNKQDMKNSIFIKKLIRDEMIRQAGQHVQHSPVEPNLVVPKEKPRNRIDLDDGGVMF